MSEKELDSSVNEYEEQYKSSNYIKQLQWDILFDNFLQDKNDYLELDYLLI